jgi:CHAT domain-containing protein
VLIAPVRAFLPRAAGSRLTVLPHGPLFLVSFAALRDGRGRYLVEDFALHYAPSASVLDATSRRARAGGVPGRRVFVADPGQFPDDGGRPLPPLPGTRREVTAGSERLKGDNVLLTGGEATEANVRRLAPGAGLLHFATHGVVRDDRPFESFLALSRDDPAGDDGRLTVRDIYGLDLQASLVVLSACRTGLGQLSSDGIVGLTRAFFYAGTPSVMATLWDVADEPTFRLVSSFYSGLAAAPDKARALRSAQLSMLRALRAGEVKVPTAAGAVTLPEHPALWAGFVLVGEP